MMHLKQLVSYLNELLEPGRFKDYAPNGLQIEGTREIKRLVVGVSANGALIAEAQRLNADAILVHHGFFWSRGPEPIVGLHYKRVAPLIRDGIALLGYHLPLDAHPVYGNNVQLLQALGADPVETFGGDPGLGWIGAFVAPAPREALVSAIAQITGRQPLAFLHGPTHVERIGVVTGSAASYLEASLEAGADMYITGEPSEQSQGLCRELEANFVAAGHHATERFGPRALGEHLASHFDLDVVFVDIDNPV